MQIKHHLLINTFAFQRLVLEEKNKPFLLGKFLYGNLTLLNFLVKIVIQKLMCEILCIFKEIWFIFIPQKQGAERRQC